MSQDLRMEKKLPIALRNDFWIQLVKSVEDEVILMKDLIKEKEFIYNIDNSSLESLYTLAEIMFGESYSSFLSLKKSLKFKYGYSDEKIEFLLRRELKKKPYQIIYKGDIRLYKTFFNTFGFSFPFELSLYTTIIGVTDEVTDFQRIKRNINSLLIEDNLSSIVGVQESDNNFLGFSTKADTPTLDHADGFILDSIEAAISQDTTTLDKQEYDIATGTKHIGFEIVINEKYLKDSYYTLFPYEVLLYVKETIKQYKRAAEVPHIGAQLTINVDNSGYNVTESSIILSSASDLTRIAEGITEISYLKFGYGAQTLPETGDAIYTFPTELEHPIADIIPLALESYNDTTHIGTIAEYVGQFFNKILLHDSTGYLLTNTGSGTFNSSNQEFTGFLPEKFLTLKPNTIVFALKKTTEGNITYEDYIEDNGYEVLIGQNRKLQGSINYTTGEYNLLSSFNASISEDFTMIAAVITLSGSLSNNVYSDTGGIIFEYESKPYSINVDAGGALTSNFEFFDESTSSFTFGTTVPSSFIFSFTKPVLLENIKFVYQFEVDETYDDTYSLELFRGYTNKQYSITEVGVYGKTDDDTIQLLSYSTFAPIEIHSNEFHLNLGVILEK